MAPILLIAAIPLARSATHYLVNQAISEGVEIAKFEIDRKILALIIETLITITINVLGLIFLTKVLINFIEQEALVLWVSAFFMGSIIYMLLRLVFNLPTFYKLLVAYKLNIKKYLEDEIYTEVYAQVKSKLKTTNPVKRLVNIVFGKSSSAIAKEITQKALYLTLSRTLISLVLLALVIGVYLLVFRLLLAPVLLEETTNLNTLQALFYPLALTSDTFFGTKLLNISFGF